MKSCRSRLAVLRLATYCCVLGLSPLVAGVRLVDKEARAEDGAMDMDAWKESTEFLLSMKLDTAEVNSNLMTGVTQHGGQEVRGIISSAAIKGKTNLLVIPKKAWMTLDNFPEMRDSSLICQDNHQELKMATAIGIEAAKQRSSKWSPYLTTLPGYKDFHAFYPRWADDELMEEFSALPLVKGLKDFKDSEEKVKKCWEEWKENGPESIEGVAATSWDDVKLALAQWRTRNHNITDSKGNYSHALLPAADLMNTGTSEQVNTAWWFEDTDHDGESDHYYLQSKGDAPKGEEYFEAYCSTCTNHDMLLSWGIYIENNDNTLDKLDDEACSQLKRHFGDYLDFSDQPKEAVRSPRCQPSTVKLVQGPMRCSLTRLAYESCGEKYKPTELVFEKGKGKGVAKGTSDQSASQEDSQHSGSTSGDGGHADHSGGGDGGESGHEEQADVVKDSEVPGLLDHQISVAERGSGKARSGALVDTNEANGDWGDSVPSRGALLKVLKESLKTPTVPT